MDKMNCFLLTTCIIVIMFCNSGYALRCYICEQSPFLCRTNVTCSYEEDACLQIRMGNWEMRQSWGLVIILAGSFLDATFILSFFKLCQLSHFLDFPFVHLRTYSCWKMSRCSKEIVAQEFSVDSFRHLCCQRDFCNKSPSLLAGTTSVGVAAVIVAWILSVM